MEIQKRIEVTIQRIWIGKNSDRQRFHKVINPLTKMNHIFSDLHKAAAFKDRLETEINYNLEAL